MYVPRALSLILCASAISLVWTPASSAQGIPLPGSSAQPVTSSAPAPGAPQPGQSAPVPGAGANSAASAYQQLPISVADAQTRLEELKALLPDSNPQSMQEPVRQLCEWLADMADAHNRLAVAFSKQESLKPQYEAEKQTTRKFSQLKYQAQLLKAELLIKQRRYPEALAPLVEIVIAEPKSGTGVTAYRHLKEIGFSEEIEVKPEVKSVAATPPVGEATAETPATQPATQPASSHPAPPAQTAAPVSHSAVQPARTTAGTSRQPNSWITGTPFGDPNHRR